MILNFILGLAVNIFLLFLLIAGDISANTFILSFLTEIFVVVFGVCLKYYLQSQNTLFARKIGGRLSLSQTILFFIFYTLTILVCLGLVVGLGDLQMFSSFEPIKLMLLIAVQTVLIIIIPVIQIKFQLAEYTLTHLKRDLFLPAFVLLIALFYVTSQQVEMAEEIVFIVLLGKIVFDLLGMLIFIKNKILKIRV